MSEERKLFSSGDEFEFKRQFVIAYLASRNGAVIGQVEGLSVGYVQTAHKMADQWWEALVAHGVNDQKPKEIEGNGSP